jgi:hypothetical protein
MNIYDEYATAEVNSTFVYTDKATKQEHKLHETIVYTIVIDDYGDYQFTNINITSSSDDGQQTNTEDGVTESNNTPTDSSGNKNTTTDDNDATLNKQSVNKNKDTKNSNQNSTSDLKNVPVNE